MKLIEFYRAANIFNELHFYSNSTVKHQKASIKFKKVMRLLRAAFEAVESAFSLITKPCQEINDVERLLRNFFLTLAEE